MPFRTREGLAAGPVRLPLRRAVGLVPGVDELRGLGGRLLRGQLDVFRLRDPVMDDGVRAAAVPLARLEDPNGVEVADQTEEDHSAEACGELIAEIKTVPSVHTSAASRVE